MIINPTHAIKEQEQLIFEVAPVLFIDYNHRDIIIEVSQQPYQYFAPYTKYPELPLLL